MWKFVLRHDIHTVNTHHKQDSEPEDDSTLSGSDTSSDDGHCCILDKYGIEDFVVLCYKCLDFDEHMLIMAMMNLDRLLEKDFVLTEQNIQKVFFLCMMEVHKFYNDVPFSNKDYSKLCGINAEELLDDIEDNPDIMKEIEEKIRGRVFETDSVGRSPARVLLSVAGSALMGGTISPSPSM